MHPRSILSGLIRKSKTSSGRILVLTGARQTGKTTLVKLGFPEMKYIALDDPIMAVHYTSMTAEQWHHSFPSAILDEVQKTPSLIESIKAVYDSFPETRYLLTGSSQLLLLNKIRETLAGRCTIFELFPLTIPEMMTRSWEEDVPLSYFQLFMNRLEIPELLPAFSMDPGYAEKKKAFSYYLSNGGYPTLIDPVMNDDERFEWLTSYVRTYLERDIRDLADFRSLEPFVKVQRMSSLLTGELLNYSELARESGVAVATAQKFINYMDISYQTIQLQPWSRNSLKRLVKSPKLHYLDPGVRNAIIRKRGDITGNEFESAVVAEIYKQSKNLNLPLFFYHLRTSDGREIDLLLESEKGYVAIEIKLASRIEKTDARHLTGLESLLDKPLILSFVLSNDDRIRQISDNVLAIPAAMFLSPFAFQSTSAGSRKQII